MLYIYPETVESVRKFVNRKWPNKNKEVYCQENESAWHQNRYILITVSPLINFKVVHYEYINGYLELHLEDEYYGNTFIRDCTNIFVITSIRNRVIIYGIIGMG